MQNKAVVVGALGVIGRYISERLVLGRDPIGKWWDCRDAKRRTDSATSISQSICLTLKIRDASSLR